jgi:hypothetical protein
MELPDLMAQRKHVPDMGEVRNVLNPRRERYDLTMVMKRWAHSAHGEQQSEPVGADEFVWCGSDDPVELLTGLGADEVE